MIQPAHGGRELLEEIEAVSCPVPRLWWLGHSGFVLKFRQAIVYVDPLLSAAPGRLVAPPFAPEQVRHAGLILCTHAGHLDPGSVPAMLAASPRAKLVIPISVARHAHDMGIPYARMVTTNAGLRVEYLDDRIYAVPSAHDHLDWTPMGGYPYLGYLVRFGDYTIYHAGDSVPYEGLADRLRPFNVTVALLPISGARPGRPGNFDIPQAAQLAADIGAEWLAPMHYGMFQDGAAEVDRFVEHLLLHRPAQRFKVFSCGEGWDLETSGHSYLSHIY